MKIKCYLYYTRPNGIITNFVHSFSPINEDVEDFLLCNGSEVRMLCSEVEKECLTNIEVESILKKEFKKMVSPVLDSSTIDLYIDLDDTIFDFNGAINKKRKESGINYPQAEYGFFANLEPLPRAIEIVKKLIADPRYNVRFATAPSVFNPMSYTEKQVSIKKHFGMSGVEKMILIKEKNLLDRSSMGIRSILIDDISIGYGQEDFNEQLVFGSPDCENWAVVEEKLLK